MFSRVPGETLTKKHSNERKRERVRSCIPLRMGLLDMDRSVFFVGCERSGHYRPRTETHSARDALPWEGQQKETEKMVDSAATFLKKEGTFSVDGPHQPLNKIRRNNAGTMSKVLGPV